MIGVEVKKFMSWFLENYNSTCSTKSDCYFAYMNCVNQKCVPMLRLPGDSCVDDNQCLFNIVPANRKTMVDMVRPKCINNKCQFYKVVKRNDGEECFVDDNINTVYDCKDGYVCYKCCESWKPVKSKCVPKVKAKKGESCSNPSVDNSIIPTFKICESGLYCKTMNDGSQLCTETLTKGANCANSESVCEEGTICRQNSPSDKTMTCQKSASYGESCVLNSDCTHSSSALVRCYNNKCTRWYGIEINGICKANDECYSGYCSTAGKCAERPSTPCSGSAYCQNSNYNNYCACGGKSSSNSPGKCVDNCLGAMIDVTTCLYNQGLLGSDFYGGLGFLQYVDEDSSLFTRCRYAFSRHYSCLRKSWIAAGIPTKGDMAGIDLDAYSVDASPIVPDEANQHQISFGLIFIMILVNFVIRKL